jgi:hypothetical protein
LFYDAGSDPANAVDVAAIVPEGELVEARATIFGSPSANRLALYKARQSLRKIVAIYDRLVQQYLFDIRSLRPISQPGGLGVGVQTSPLRPIISMA